MKDEQLVVVKDPSKIILEDEEYLVVLVPSRSEMFAYDKEIERSLLPDNDASSWYEIAYRLALKVPGA